MTISVNRALAELKLVTKKIEQKTVNLTVAAPVKSLMEEGERKKIVTEFESELQKLTNLVKRRNSLKSAIVLSNAQTVVTIGSKECRVAEAIERKTSIQIERDISRKLREAYYAVKDGVDGHNNKVSADADKHALAALSSDTEGDKGTAYKTIVDAYKLKNEATLLAPKDIEKTIEDMQDSIDEFESEVDFILSESNIKTMIDV